MGWTPLDLLIRADARDIIRNNTQLCIEAVQKRFYGQGSLVFALQRLNRRIDSVLGWTVTQATADDSSAQSLNEAQAPPKIGSNVWRFLARLDRLAQSMSSTAEGEPIVTWKLAACLAVDAVGISSYLFPILPAVFYRYLWPLIAAAVVNYMHRNTCLTLLVLFEELMPLVDLIPSATVGYLLQRQLEHEQKEADLGYDDVGLEDDREAFVPFDHFALDIISHCVLAYLLTLVLMSPNSVNTFCLELLILFFMIMDEIPDIVFGGIDIPALATQYASISAKEVISLSMVICNMMNTTMKREKYFSS